MAKAVAACLEDQDDMELAGFWGRGDDLDALVSLADVVIDFVGATSTLELARGVVRSMGDVTIVGIAGGEIPVSFFSQPYEVSIATTYWGSRPELAELLALAASGQISAERSIYSLEHGARAYRDLRDNLVTGRAVVVP